MILISMMATVWDCVRLLMHIHGWTVATLVLVRLCVWDCEGVAGMILFQMLHTAFIILAHARVLLQPTGTV